MKLIKLLFILLLAASKPSYGQQIISGDSLVSDFKYLIKSLEETHPDPYTGFGGKFYFHKAAYDVEQELKEGTTIENFTSLASSFLAKLEDEHTILNRPKKSIADSLLALPLDIAIVSDGLFISKISEEHKHLIGSKLISINGIPVSELAQKTEEYQPSENLYGKYGKLRSFLNQYHEMRKLLPTMGRTISLTLELPSKQAILFNITYVEPAVDKEVKKAAQPSWEKIRENDYLYFDFLDRKKQAMYLRFSSVMARECFVYMQQNGWSSLEQMLGYMYSLLKKEKPEDINEAIAAIPSYSETFKLMLEEMKANASDYLIIDLRNNSGGFTGITLPSLYMLYGDSYLTTDVEMNFYRLISPLYMEKIGTTLDEFNRKNKTNYTFGDYTFDKKNSEAKSLPEQRKSFAASLMGDASQHVKELDGKPVYTPKNVFVVTDCSTFSAAFHYAYYLQQMGAIIVGVPSKQAPNTYMESTPYTLPLTKLSGSISNSIQECYPPSDWRAKVLYPDMMLEWKDYQKYGFDKHTELLYLLDTLELEAEL